MSILTPSKLAFPSSRNRFGHTQILPQMIQVIKDGGIEQFDRPMPSQYWLRNKKQTINYVHDTPFATTRQLEDQRLLQQLNRNPQAGLLTKVDKVRSQTISQSHAASRPVAVKANVLNKIVREASGVHNYTIVAPPKSLDDDSAKRVEKLEPELNPRVRPYAQEAKLKPILCSFGHRPRSASRTFHPATMKFRLKHGEIAKGGDNVHKTGFGLPVAVLAQVLKAPKIPSSNHTEFASSLETGGDDDEEEGEGDEFEDIADDEGQGDEGATSNESQHQQGIPGMQAQQENYSDLFLSETDQQKLFRNVKKGDVKHKKRHKKKPPSPNASLADGSSLEKPSWISSVEKRRYSSPKGARNSKANSPSAASALKEPSSPTYAIFANSTIEYPEYRPLPSQLDNRPAWDEAHHRVEHSVNHVFQMRASGLNKGGLAMPLADRLQRFSKSSVAEVQPVLFCTEKQETDKKLMAGEPHIVPKSVAVKGQVLFTDPNDVEVQIIQYYRKQALREEARKRKAKQYQDMLKTIPKVDYYPTSILRDMRTRENSTAESANSQMSGVLPPEASLTFTDNSFQRASVSGKFAPGQSDLGFGFSGSLAHSSTSTAGRSHKFLLPPVDTSILQQTDGTWQDLEADSQRVMSAAKMGDERALYNFSMLERRPTLSPLGPPPRTYMTLPSAAAVATEKSNGKTTQMNI